MNLLAIIGFFTGGIGRWIVLAVVISATAIFARQHFINEGRHQVLAENQRAAVKIVAKQGAVTEKIVTQYVKVEGKTKIVTETIEKDVIRYESTKLDTCPVSVGFVILHNSAAANSIPDTTRSIDGSASGVTANQALGTVTGNYSTFHETADRLRALQSWVKEQAKVR